MNSKRKTTPWKDEDALKLVKQHQKQLAKHPASSMLTMQLSTYHSSASGLLFSSTGELYHRSENIHSLKWM